MDLASLVRRSEHEWWIPAAGGMRVPGIIYGSEPLIRAMDDKVREQVSNVAMLPGIRRASYAMPDAHWGYGFPIGGVAAFDPQEGGIVSAGGVGFDISCGVRTLRTGLTLDAVSPVKQQLATGLSRSVPAGVGSHGRIHLDEVELDAMLKGGAQWAVERGYGVEADLDGIEDGCVDSLRVERSRASDWHGVPEGDGHCRIIARHRDSGSGARMCSGRVRAGAALSGGDA